MAAPLTRDRTSAHRLIRTVGPARTFCLVVGPALAINGALGLLLAGAELDTGDNLPRHEWNFFFHFNGWHEVLHVATGALLTIASSRERWAARGALTFGAIYAVLNHRRAGIPRRRPQRVRPYSGQKFSTISASSSTFATRKEKMSS
jgi:hypothetical protein